MKLKCEVRRKKECIQTVRTVSVLLYHPLNSLCQCYVVLSLWFLCGPVKGGTLLQASLTVVFSEMPSITIRIKQNILLSLSSTLPAESRSIEQGFAGDEFPASLITSEITLLQALHVQRVLFELANLKVSCLLSRKSEEYCCVSRVQ